MKSLIEFIIFDKTFDDKQVQGTDFVQYTLSAHEVFLVFSRCFFKEGLFSIKYNTKKFCNQI